MMMMTMVSDPLLGPDVTTSSGDASSSPQTAASSASSSSSSSSSQVTAGSAVLSNLVLFSPTTTTTMASTSSATTLISSASSPQFPSSSDVRSVGTSPDLTDFATIDSSSRRQRSHKAQSHHQHQHQAAKFHPYASSFTPSSGSRLKTTVTTTPAPPSDSSSSSSPTSSSLPHHHHHRQYTWSSRGGGCQSNAAAAPAVIMESASDEGLKVALDQLLSSSSSSHSPAQQSLESLTRLLIQNQNQNQSHLQSTLGPQQTSGLQAKDLILAAALILKNQESMQQQQALLSSSSSSSSPAGLKSHTSCFQSRRREGHTCHCVTRTSDDRTTSVRHISDSKSRVVRSNNTHTLSPSCFLRVTRRRRRSCGRRGFCAAFPIWLMFLRPGF